MADYISPVFNTGEEVDEALTAGLQSKSALVELVDGGAKNRLPFSDLAVIKTMNTGGTWVDNAYTWNGVTFTINSDYSVTVEGTATGGNAVLVLSRTGGFSIEDGSWVLSGCPEGGGGTAYNITIARNGQRYRKYRRIHGCKCQTCQTIRCQWNNGRRAYF